MNLRKDLADKYCQCCGRKNSTIWKFLMKQPIIQHPKTIGASSQEWKGHKVYKGHDYFYDTNALEYCFECGEKLADEDVKTSTESRGEFWGAPCSETIVVGFHCSKCGTDETF